MTSKLDEAVKAQKDLVAAATEESEARDATRQNRKPEARDTWLAAHIKLRNAKERAYATFKKLNAVEQAQVYEMVAAGEVK